MWNVRVQILERIAAVSDWIVPGSNLEEGRVDPSKACTEWDSNYTPVYHEAYKLPAVHRAAHNEELLSVLGGPFEAEAIPHPQKIIRLWFPKFTKHTTPFHQDFVALPNTTKNRLRISLDNRYNRLGLPISENMLNPHHGASWESVYEDWDDRDELKYYWRDLDFERIPLDTSFDIRAVEEAFRLAEERDEDAIIALTRLAAGNLETESNELSRERIVWAREKLQEIGVT